jgi:hypothetical protein
MIDCPNCRQPMAARPTPSFGAVPRDVEVDACASCNLFWFDRAESMALTPQAVLSLFRLIGEVGAARTALHDTMACPRCRHSLAFTHDIQRRTRFTYWRCTSGDGQLITFGQFLAAKDLIRPPSPAELARLRATVREVNCSQCGAPVDLATRSACAHCGAAIMLVDPDSIAKALRELETAAANGGSPPVAAADAEAARTAMTNAQIDALFDLERAREQERDAHRGDLLAIGAHAIGAALGAFFALR